MVLYHKYDAQIKIYQFFKFQKVLFIKILPNLTFQNCFISIIIYMYIISLECGMQPKLQHTGSLMCSKINNRIWLCEF
jgi:hypothetical protein